MKKFIAPLFVAVLMVIGFDANAQIKVGYVDSEVILKQLPESQAVQKQLEDMQKLYVDTITTKENDLKTRAETFRTQYTDAQQKVQSGQIASESEGKALEEQLTAMQTEIQTLDESLQMYKQNVQNALIQRQAELFKPVKDKITKAIEDVAKQQKIAFVFDKADGTLLYGDKQYDITFDVMKKLQ